jgi:hypothetical protein
MHFANVSEARADVQPWQHLRTLYDLNGRLAENTTGISPRRDIRFLVLDDPQMATALQRRSGSSDMPPFVT